MTTSQGLGSVGYGPTAVKSILGDPRSGLTATGATLSTALALPSTFCVINNVPAGSGVRLPTYIQSLGQPMEGDHFMVENRGENALNVYPGAISGTVGAQSRGAPYVLDVGAKARFFYCGLNQWAVLLGV